jgi:hypothetical protein
MKQTYVEPERRQRGSIAQRYVVLALQALVAILIVALLVAGGCGVYIVMDRITSTHGTQSLEGGGAI